MQNSFYSVLRLGLVVGGAFCLKMYAQESEWVAHAADYRRSIVNIEKERDLLQEELREKQAEVKECEATIQGARREIKYYSRYSVERKELHKKLIELYKERKRLKEQQRDMHDRIVMLGRQKEKYQSSLERVERNLNSRSALKAPRAPQEYEVNQTQVDSVPSYFFAQSAAMDL